MRSWMIAYVTGVVVFHLWGVLLPVTCSILLLLLSLTLFLFQSRIRWLSFFLVSLVWSSYYSELNKNKSLDEAYESVSLYAVGYVCSIPKQSSSVISFELCDSSIRYTPKGDVLAGGLHLKLSWYTDKPKELTGRQQFIVRLKRPHGMVNPHGFLYEKWLFRKGINAVGYVKRSIDENLVDVSSKVISPNSNCSSYDIRCAITSFRIDINEYLSALSSDLVHVSLIKALSLGYRGDIDSASWSLFKNTGTQHLIAISGLHIGLVFGMAMGLMSVLWRLIRALAPTVWLGKIGVHKHYSAVLFGLACALAYAAMAGFLVSTQRALIMLIVYYGCGLTRQYINSNTRLLIAATVVLFIDPNAVLDYGFWLSFLAVWVLFFTTIRHVRENSTRLGTWFRGSVSMQWVIFVGLLPILLASGIGVSYTSLVANFVAIPLVGMITVPAILSGLITHPFSLTLSGYLMTLADKSLDLLFMFLELFNDFTVLGIGVDSIITVVALSVMVLAIVVLPVWRGIKVWLVLSIVLFMFFKPASKVSTKTEVVVLDVGQGLSVVATNGRSAVVYDVGPAYRVSSAAQRSLVPYLKAKGIEHIEMMVVSHGDDDHSGGLSDVAKEFSIGRLISGQPERLKTSHQVELCKDGLSVDQVWYAASFYYAPALSGKTLSSNNHSCIVKFQFNKLSVLLMGDIEKNIERMLVSQYRHNLKADLLIAGHHGSKNATSTYLLNHVMPDWVVFSAGYKSRFQHPHPETVQRVSDFGAKMLDTAKAGAILIQEDENEVWEVTSYRDKLNMFWLF